MLCMNDKSLVGFTVVVPSFNQGQFIDETLRSLIDQKYPNLEIIVMDGGSSDDTVERLRQYGDAISWVSEPDNGQSDAIAKGFLRAKHDWITWLNSDDIQCNRSLWAVSEVISLNEGVDVIIGRGHYMDADGSNPRPYPTIDAGSGVDVVSELFNKGYVAQPSVFFRRAAYVGIGGVNPSLRFCMDYDLWVRFATNGCRFAPCPEDISGNRWYETTKTSGQLLELLAEVSHAQVRHFGRVSPYFVQAVSDNLYSKLHSTHFGDDHHIIYRLLYFKAIWLCFNFRRPLYCLRGLLFETIAKSGPVIGDKLTISDIWVAIRKALGRRWAKK